MSQFLQIFKTLLIFLFLTIITQVGGIIYLLYKPLGAWIRKRFESYKSLGFRVAALLVLYLMINFTLVPLAARQFGRVAMPVVETNKVKPGTFFTWFLNRHYVNPELKELLFDTAEGLPRDTKLVYLDANFPFINGFPLLPHLSHDDGNKIDLAFIYSDEGGQKLNDIKSISGYGVVEAPAKGEYDQPAVCKEKGYWQYSLLATFSNQNRTSNYEFDPVANAELLNKLASNKKSGKIFIEPHLKRRMGLTNKKFRFHGCQAVRHDDHIHVQL